MCSQFFTRFTVWPPLQQLAQGKSITQACHKPFPSSSPLRRRSIQIPSAGSIQGQTPLDRLAPLMNHRRERSPRSPHLPPPRALGLVMLSEPEPEGPWVILARVPEVVDNALDHSNIPRGRDLGFIFNYPPRASMLMVGGCIARHGTISINYPYIAMADQTGCFLLLCSRRHSDVAEYLVWRRTEGKDQEHQVFLSSVPTVHMLVCEYYICDTITCMASSLPVYPGDDELMVVKLQTTNENLLRCYSTSTGQWVSKMVTFDPANPTLPTKWCNNDTIFHADRLWWVDLAVGLFTCNPFDDKPLMSHVALPKRCEFLESLGGTSFSHHFVYF